MQDRALRIVYIDYKSSLKELLQKNKSITIHQRNLQYLAIEIQKVRMGISPKIMNEIFRFSKNSVYSLRSCIQLEKRSISTVQLGSESTVYLGAKCENYFLKTLNLLNQQTFSKVKLKNGYQKFVHADYAKHTSGWFCKLITSCLSPLLPYCFQYSQKIESTKKNSKYLFKKNYSFIT